MAGQHGQDASQARFPQSARRLEAFRETVEGVRRDFPVMDDPVDADDRRRADDILRALGELPEEDYRLFVRRYPLAWIRALPICYERLADAIPSLRYGPDRTASRRIMERLLGLMRRHMTPSLKRALWERVQMRYPDPTLEDYLLPFLAEQDARYQGQPSIAETLGTSLHRFTLSRILPEPGAESEALREWAESFCLDLTRPLGAAILAESVWLWRPEHYARFRDILYPALPAMDAGTAAAFLEATCSPPVYSEALVEAAFVHLQPTYGRLEDPSPTNFWSHVSSDLRARFAAFSRRHQMTVQAGEDVRRQKLYAELIPHVCYVFRPNPEDLLMDFGSWLLIDRAARPHALHFIDRTSFARLMEQGRSLDSVIEHFETARFLGDGPGPSVPEGRIQLGLLPSQLPLTRRFLEDLIDAS